MTLLAALAAGPAHWRGPGVNHEGESFEGRLAVEPLEGGRAVLLRYAAHRADGVVVHSECTLLGTAPDGRLALWPVMSELPMVLPHREVHAQAGPDAVLAVFASGPLDDTAAFREEITLRLAGRDALTYAHAWGLPGEAFAPRSSCTMAPRPPGL